MIGFPPDSTLHVELERVRRDTEIEIYRAADERSVEELDLAHVEWGMVAIMAARGLNDPSFNRVQGFGCGGITTESEVEAAVAWMRDRCAPAWQMQLVPESLPADFDALAARLGLVVTANNSVQLYRGDAPLSTALPGNEAEVTVREIGPGEARSCLAVGASVLGQPGSVTAWLSNLVGRPRWHAYAAYDGAEPVSVGLMFVEGVWASFVGGATLTSARGKGAQSALLRRRIEDGLALGAKHFAVTCSAARDGDRAGSTSLRNVARCGFSPAYLRRTYGPDGRGT